MFGKAKGKRYIEDMTQEEIKAYLSSNAPDVESEETKKDKIDESVGETEKDTKTEDSQTAKDRVDESVGETEADSTSKTEEPVKTTSGESSTDNLKDIVRQIVAEELAKLKKKAPEKTEATTSSRLDKLSAMYEE